MADHRAEQILDAFTALVTGLTTTGANVVRDRPYNIDESISSALSVYQGDDTPFDSGLDNWQLEDKQLDISVDIHVKQSSEIPISKQLNQIRKEIHIALMADRTLGLSFARNFLAGVAETPEIEAGEKVTAKQTLNFSIDYRASVTDPSLGA